MDLDDRPLARRLVPLPMDGRRLFEIGGGGVALRRGYLLGYISCAHNILVVLEIAIRMIVVILGTLILVDRL